MQYICVKIQLNTYKICFPPLSTFRCSTVSNLRWSCKPWVPSTMCIVHCMSRYLFSELFKIHSLPYSVPSLLSSLYICRAISPFHSFCIFLSIFLFSFVKRTTTFVLHWSSYIAVILVDFHCLNCVHQHLIIEFLLGYLHVTHVVMFVYMAICWRDTQPSFLSEWHMAICSPTGWPLYKRSDPTLIEASQYAFSSYQAFSLLLIYHPVDFLQTDVIDLISLMLNEIMSVPESEHMAPKELTVSLGILAQFQYPIRRLIVRSREVSKPRDW